MNALIQSLNKVLESLPMPEALKPYAGMVIPLALKLALAVVVILIGKWIASWVESQVDKVSQKAGFDETLSAFLASLAKYGILAMAIIAALGQLGVKTTGVLAIVTACTGAIGLALSDNLGNFAAGTMILGFRPMSKGDKVGVGDITGDVQQIGIFCTEMKNSDNERYIVPNGKFTEGAITNYTSRDYRRVSTDIGVAYGADLDKCEEVLRQAASQTAHRVQEEEPDVFITGFGASSIDFNVRVHAPHEHYWAVVHDLRKQVYKALNDASIEIPFEQRVDIPASV